MRIRSVTAIDQTDQLCVSEARQPFDKMLTQWKYKALKFGCALRELDVYVFRN